MLIVKQKRFRNDGEYRQEGNKIYGGVVGLLYEVREKEDYFLNIFTLERPLKFNKIENVKNDKSTILNEATCIPAGEYDVVLEYSKRFDRKLFEIKGVPNRSECKFHAGNHIDHSDGCPLVGKVFYPNTVDQKTKKVYSLWIARAKEAEKEMLDRLPEKFKLIITNEF